MSEETKKTGLSRREFLKDAGLVVGGAAVGTTVFAAAGCKEKIVEKEVIVQVEVPGPGDPRLLYNVNGRNYALDRVEPYWSLNFVLREKFGLTFTKNGCDRGQCGHCTVLVDGVPMYSCLVLAVDAAGGKKEITTAESLAPDMFNLTGIAKEFHDNEAFQCGWCTAGFMMATKALLAENARPSLQEVREALAGHLCICTAIKEVCETVVMCGEKGVK